MKRIETLLKASDPRPAPMAREAFARAAREHAIGIEQEQPGARARYWKWMPAPALAAVACVLLVALWPHPHQEAKLLTLDVTADYESVMVMVDQENGGTIVWVDME